MVKILDWEKMPARIFLDKMSSKMFKCYARKNAN